MVGGCSQRLLCLNPTTVMVVLLLGLWLLLGCDNIDCNKRQHQGQGRMDNCIIIDNIDCNKRHGQGAMLSYTIKISPGIKIRIKYRL